MKISQRANAKRRQDKSQSGKKQKDKNQDTAFHRRVYPNPKDHREARTALYRMMCDIKNSWKECPLRVCRRQRACHGEHFECHKPGPPVPEKVQAKVRFEMAQMLDAEIARRRALRGEAEEKPYRWSRVDKQHAMPDPVAPVREKDTVNQEMASKEMANKRASPR